MIKQDGKLYLFLTYLGFFRYFSRLWLILKAMWYNQWTHSTIVVVSLHVDEQPYQAIWSFDYWFGCSDSPNLRLYLAKNVKISKFVCPRWTFFSKKIFKNILKVVSIRFRWFWDDLRKKYFFDFSNEIPRLWLTLEAAPYIQSVYPFSCTISTYR